MTNIISFPGLGIGEFKLNTVAFNLFGKDIAWYGIIITVGIICAYSYVNWRGTKFEGLKSDDVLDYTIFAIIFAIIGARAYYVLTTLDTHKYESFIDVIAIWNGGIAIYGAIIAGFITILVVAKRKRQNPTKVLDPLGVGLMIGQSIGRWGNFVNAEAHGGPTDLPWRMGIQNVYNFETIYVHPTFLYESLWNLVGIIWINAVYKKKKFGGQIFLMYIAWYGFGRMLIEGLRTDSLYIGPFRISQLIGLISCVVALALIAVGVTRAKKKPVAESAEVETEESVEESNESNETTESDEESEETNKTDNTEETGENNNG